MRNLAVVLLLLAVVGLSSADWMNGGIVKPYRNSYEPEEFPEDKRTRVISNARDLCIPWRAPCPSDSSLSKQYEFLRCCDGTSCKCTFWGNNCKCEARLGR